MALRSVAIRTNSLEKMASTIDSIMQSEGGAYTVVANDGIILTAGSTITRDVDGSVMMSKDLFKKNSDSTYETILIMDCTIA